MIKRPSKTHRQVNFYQSSLFLLLFRRKFQIQAKNDPKSPKILPGTYLPQVCHIVTNRSLQAALSVLAKPGMLIMVEVAKEKQLRQQQPQPQNRLPPNQQPQPAHRVTNTPTEDVRISTNVSTTRVATTKNATTLSADTNVVILDTYTTRPTTDASILTNAVASTPVLITKVVTTLKVAMFVAIKTVKNLTVIIKNV